jgi:hypothetical protein
MINLLRVLLVPWTSIPSRKDEARQSDVTSWETPNERVHNDTEIHVIKQSPQAVPPDDRKEEIEYERRPDCSR